MNLTILYEDNDLIVCLKPSGIASQNTSGFEITLVDLIKQHLSQQSSKKGEPYLGIIHRLDKPVGGVMVYAKTKEAAAALSKQLASNQIKKRYYAVLSKSPKNQSDTLIHYLVHDKKKNYSFVSNSSNPQAKKAELSYQILEQKKKNTQNSLPSCSSDTGSPHFSQTIHTSEENSSSCISIQEETITLVDISLKTGRHHQIRVQFSHIGCPLFGDRKYNPAVQLYSQQSVALYSYYLEFIHPRTKKRLQFSSPPSNSIWDSFTCLR